eukprot:GHVO01069890.1.p1 GENE.GHVO01069890.1~~GHVO01069890.1.p1  ORF type:complete len:361 (+),score=16.60 GHVO01069890.1:72-1154(+)
MSSPQARRPRIDLGFARKVIRNTVTKEIEIPPEETFTKWRGVRRDKVMQRRYKDLQNTVTGVELTPSHVHLHHYAFVVWIVKDTDYVKGAMVTGSSLRFCSPGISRICLVDSDSSFNEHIESLTKIYDYVIRVDPVVVECVHQNWRRFEKLYDWINLCFTRLYALYVGEKLGFKKVIVVDADTIFLHDLSELFSLECPAGITSVFGTSEQCQKWHGKEVPKAIFDESAQAWGFRGCLMLMKPSIATFKRLIHILKTDPPDKYPDAIGKFGTTLNYIGPDEYLLLNNLPGPNESWHCIHPRFCVTSWHIMKLRSSYAPDGNEAKQAGQYTSYYHVLYRLKYGKITSPKYGRLIGKVMNHVS